MAESKPTKLQMAKEAQKLINAAEDMSAVMDLDPAIKTDYLIDLKNKTVTISHLNQVIGSLQADIKAVAVEIEPEDKFQKGTHEVLADLNVKVPRSVIDEVVEDEDEIMPTPSPSDVVEHQQKVQDEEKPIKKKKKNTTDHSKSNKGRVYIAWKDGENDFEKLSGKIDGAVKLSTIKGWCNAWKNGNNLPAVAKQ